MELKSFFTIQRIILLLTTGLLCMIAKKRAGHFDNPEKSTFPTLPRKPPDPDLREVLTGTPWPAILVPGGLAILVILAVLTLVLWTK